MTALGLVMMGLAVALLVVLATHPRCGWCHRPTRAKVRHYGGPKGMTGRFCGECRPMVQAIDASGAVEAVEAELSTAISTLQLEAA